MTAKDIDDSFFGDAPGVPEFVVKDGFDRAELTAKIGETFSWVLTTPSLPDVLAHEELVNGIRASRPDFSTMSNAELTDYVMGLADKHFRDLVRRAHLRDIPGHRPGGDPDRGLRCGRSAHDVLKLIAGVGDVESAAPSMVMWELGRLAAGSAELGAMFEAGTNGLDARLRASDDADVARFVEAFDRFLFSYGCRGPNEWESRSPTWETEPDLALAAIDRMRLSDESQAPAGHNAERAAEREAPGGRDRGHDRGRPRGSRSVPGRTSFGDGVHAGAGADQDQLHQAGARVPGRAARDRATLCCRRHHERPS